MESSMQTNSEHCIRNLRTRESPAPRVRVMATVRDTLATWWVRSRHRAGLRRVLDRLDDRLLRDIGTSRQALAHEARKPFWRD